MLKGYIVREILGIPVLQIWAFGELRADAWFALM